MKENLVLDHLSACPGEKISGYISVINAEYVGIQAALELSRELRAAGPEVNATFDAMARAGNVPYRYPSHNPSGGAYNHAGSMGVPGILLERGGRSL